MQKGTSMARDDYHVIVYQILSYLYQCLKKGKKVESKNLEHNCKYFQINKEYWVYILYHMQKSGLIEGISFIDIDGMELPYPTQLGDCRITPTGIEYLCDNSFMEKAKKFLKDIKEITPFT